MKNIMNKKHFLVLSILTLAIIWGKPSKRLTGNSIIIKQDPYSSEEIYKLKDLYDAGNHSALDAMIAIYQNQNQSYDIRILCLDLLSTLDNPLI